MKNMKSISLFLVTALTVAGFGGCATEPDAVPPTLSVDAEEIVMTVGDTATIAYSIDPADAAERFTADNNDIIVVDASGKVVALASGETIVTLETGDISEVIPITVKAVEPETPLQPSITLAAVSAELVVGDTYPLDVAVENIGDYEVVYSSDDESVLTVNVDGLVTALSAGSATVTVKVGEVSEAVMFTVARAESMPEVSAVAAQSDGSSSASSVPSAPVPASSAPAAPQAAGTSSGVSGALVGYPVTVNDMTAVATTASVDGSLTTYTFYSSSGKVLGSISNSDFIKIKINAQKNGAIPSGGYDATTWFTEQFNLYRGLGSSNVSNGLTGGAASSSTTVDTVVYADEIVQLTNAKRREAGLNELVVDSSLTSLALVRAEEIVTLQGHTRPDGTTLVDMGYGENCAYSRVSPQDAFDSWWTSSGHKANIN